MKGTSDKFKVTFVLVSTSCGRLHHEIHLRFSIRGLCRILLEILQRRVESRLLQFHMGDHQRVQFLLQRAVFPARILGGHDHFQVIPRREIVGLERQHKLETFLRGIHVTADVITLRLREGVLRRYFLYLSVAVCVNNIVTAVIKSRGVFS